MHVVRKTMPFDVRRAFVPVTQLVVVPQALIVHPGVPARSVADFIALARREPGKLTYGSAGIGTAPHMAMELFKSMAGIDVQHIPYRGVSQSVTDILGGRVSGMVLNVLTSKPQLDAGKLRALGVTGAKRSEALPDVPTITENALPRLRGPAMVRHPCPRRHARARRQLLQTRIAEGMRSAETKARLAADGAEAVASTPAEFAALSTKRSRNGTRWQRLRIFSRRNERAIGTEQHGGRAAAIARGDLGFSPRPRIKADFL